MCVIKVSENYFLSIYSLMHFYWVQYPSNQSIVSKSNFHPICYSKGQMKIYNFFIEQYLAVAASSFILVFPVFLDIIEHYCTGALDFEFEIEGAISSLLK